MASKNQFKRAISSAAAASFLNGAKTAQVAEQDRIEQEAEAAGQGGETETAPEPVVPPITTPVPTVAPTPSPAPLSAAQPAAASLVDAHLEAEVEPSQPRLRSMEAAAAPKAPPITAPLPPPPAAPEVIYRPDGEPTNERVQIQVNFKMPEPKYWQVKDFVDSTPRLSLRQFLEDAAMEKLARMKAEVAARK